MLRYWTNNDAVSELIIANGIDLIADDNNEIYVTEETAVRIDAIVLSQAPAAADDYGFDTV